MDIMGTLPARILPQAVNISRAVKLGLGTPEPMLLRCSCCIWGCFLFNDENHKTNRGCREPTFLADCRSPRSTGALSSFLPGRVSCTDLAPQTSLERFGLWHEK